jgi:hypothetical protein
MRCQHVPVLALLALSACGGDGSGASRPGAPPASPGGGSQAGQTSGATPGGGTSDAAAAPGGATAGAAGEATPFAISTRPELQWKRHVALENDLSAALDLPPEELCRELGTDSCIRSAHISALGGNDPFASGMLEPSAEPMATSPNAYERVVLSACANRSQAELKGSKPALVFAGVDLKGAAPAPGDPAARELVVRLYRRFLARDPDPAEIELVASLAADAAGRPQSGLGFAQAACFAVGTNTEFIFF